MHHNPAKNVLIVAEPLETIAHRLEVDFPAAESRLRQARAKLLEARTRRPTPFVDRTRYSSWNAMLAGALLQASAALDEPWAGEHALRTLRRLRCGTGCSRPDRAHRRVESPECWKIRSLPAWPRLMRLNTAVMPEWLEWAVAIMNRVWNDYLDPSRRRTVRSGAQPRRGGTVADHCQAGTGCTDSLGQWRWPH